jgi:hypothetical protein
MRQSTEAVAWVVYTVLTVRDAGTRVCEESEWEQMMQFSSGHYKLVRAGIRNEAEAENLARTLSGFVERVPSSRLKRGGGR